MADSALPAKVAAELQKLTEELNAAIASGDLGAADGLQRQMSRTLARLNNAMAASAAGEAPRSVGPTQREVVISLLAPVGDVSPARFVRDLAAAEGLTIKSTGFPAMLRSDERSWRSNPAKKPVLVVPGIEATTLAPMTSWIALSSFGLAHRVVTPVTPRAGHLRMLLHVVGRLAGPDAPPPNVEALEALARRWASAMPETRVFGAFDAHDAQRRAAEALKAVGEAEDAQRTEAAERLATATPAVALFGFRELTIVHDDEGVQTK